jgi:hypothetical protein
VFSMYGGSVQRCSLATSSSLSVLRRALLRCDDHSGCLQLNLACGQNRVDAAVM